MKYKLVDMIEGYDVVATSNRKDSIIKAAKEYWLDTDGECDLMIAHVCDGHRIEEYIYLEYEETEGKFDVDYYQTIDRGVINH